MLIGVIIPVYNEAATLRHAIERLDAATIPEAPQGPCDRVVVIVDDGSTDGSSEVVRELSAREDVIVSIEAENKGKGAALRRGFELALGRGCDVVLVHDADLEYDPADHEAVLRPILDGRADAVIGTRFLGQSHRVLYFWHYTANKVITLLSNMLSNLNLTDIECGSKAISRRALEQITITEDRFGVEPELIARLAKLRLPDKEGRARNARIFEVPVSYAGRTYEDGKKITWRDGIAALRCIIVYNLR